MKIWVDDIREPDDSWVWLVSSKEAIDWLERQKAFRSVPALMSLDHDLGGEDTTRPVVMWMIENDFWPDEVRVHSANPVGIDWLEGMIERYKK